MDHASIISFMHSVGTDLLQWIYTGDVCRSLPKEIAIFGKVTDIDCIPTGSCVDRVTVVFCLQIAENFSEDLHGTANLINKVVTMCTCSVYSLDSIARLCCLYPKYQITACM